MSRFTTPFLGLVALALVATPAAAEETGTKTKAPSKAVNQPLDLMDAYKKEYAFLEAERDALNKRLSAARARTRRDTGAIKGAIARKQKDVLALRAEAETIAAELEKLGRETVDVDEQAELVPDTLERATQSLDKLGATLPKVSAEETVEQRLARMQHLIEASGAKVLEGGTIRREKGVFFAFAGTRLEGTIVKVGRVARFGVSDDASGALVPAGNGHFRIWPAEATDTAKALAAGSIPASMNVYLFENVEKAVEAKKEKTVEDVIESGGTIAWVIVGLGAVALLLILFRAFLLILLGASTKRAIARVTAKLSDHDLAGAQTVATKVRGAIGRVIRSTLGALHQPREARDDTIAESILEEVPRIERFGTTITVIAAVAPLMGLLGTVTGMISTFDIITEFGTGDPKLLAGGISEALVTTELGLIVAIPTLLIGTLLSGRASQIQLAIERGALHVVNAAQLAGMLTDEPGAVEATQAPTTEAVAAAAAAAAAPAKTTPSKTTPSKTTKDLDTDAQEWTPASSTLPATSSVAAAS